MANPSGVWQGQVERVDGARLWVSIEQLHAGHTYGPCSTLEMPATPGLSTAAAGHVHALSAAPLAVGDAVLVAFFQGVHDHPVVLGRLTS